MSAATHISLPFNPAPVPHRPLVSVLLPYRNAQHTLAAAVESILAQSYTNIELILVNNGSTDQSRAVAEQFAHTDPRVRCAEEPRRGVVFATEKAYSLARGTLIARMDADDTAFPEKLEKQVAYLLAHPQLGGVSCLVENGAHEDIAGGGMDYYVQWTNTRISAEEIAISRFVESPIINPTILLRRATVEQHGLYRSGDFPEDYELWLRLLHRGVLLAKVPEVLLRWNDSSHRLTRTDSLYSTDAFYRIKSRYAALALQPVTAQCRQLFVWGAGRVTRHRVALLEAEGVRIDRFIDLKANAQGNVMCYRDLVYSPAVFVLVYVASRGARADIQAYLTALGFAEGTDFLCMA